LLLTSAKCAIGEETNNPSGYNDRLFTFGPDDKLNQAISSLSQQIQDEPTNTPAIYNLALAYRVEGAFDKSLVLWNDYIRLNPTNDMAYKFRATIYNVTGKYGEAIKDFTAGLRLKPKDADALANRGFAYSQRGEYDKAAQDFTEAVRLDANNDKAFNNLAWLRATCPIALMRDGKEAEFFATKACNLSHWARWTHIDTLAAAYAEAGDFTEAIKYDKMALKMNGVAKSDIEELHNHISLYEKQQPYRDSGRP
jgi:tetratricopeptide (TPR) repeat protein